MTWYAEEAVPKRKLEGSVNDEDEAALFSGRLGVLEWDKDIELITSTKIISMKKIVVVVVVSVLNSILGCIFIVNLW